MMHLRSGRKKNRSMLPSYRQSSDRALPGTPLFLRKEPLVLGLAFAVLAAALVDFRPPSDKGVDLHAIDSELVARETFEAEFPFEVEDLKATRKLREAASATVPDIYQVDSEAVRRRLDDFDKRVRALGEHREAVAAAVREALEKAGPDEAADEVVSRAVADYIARHRGAPAFEGLADTSVALWLTPRIGPAATTPAEPAADEEEPADDADATEPPEAEEEQLEFAHFDRLETAARAGLEYVLKYGILEDPVPGDPDAMILVQRDEPVADQGLREGVAAGKVPVLAEVAAVLRDRIAQAEFSGAEAAAGAPARAKELEDAAFEMASLELGATLAFDRAATQREREAEASRVEPVMKSFMTGEKIIRDGTRWDEQSRLDVRTFLKEKARGRKPAVGALAALAARMVFAALVLFCLVRGTPVFTGGRKGGFADLNRALLLMCATLILGRVVSYFDPTGLSVPAAACAILLAILIDVRLAAFTGLLVAFLLCIQYNYDWRVFVEAAAMSLAGAFGIARVRRRNDLTRAALKATVAGLVTMVAVTLATGSFAGGEALRRMLLIGLNGAACLFIVPGLLPSLERVFGVTTDIQLLEYSDLNNEVLGRLAIDVPATYAHSLMLGQLAEAAAVAIGANGLLARVCAYYHDIGKLRRPAYFSENQTGANVHDDMSPRLSARAIASHVLEGAEMARECRLPKPIVDAILEHHGTCMISFFYHQALEQQKHGDVNEDDFRYPGPKPQSRETAILMICDAVESAVRSIKNPNKERVQELVDKIIAGRADDGQFDECDITLKELSIIGQVVSGRIAASLHRRVAYPDQPAAEPAANVVPMPGGRVP